ncbi:MAG: GPW/gp25 family protein [Planctomycetes bacterium]|nr:GPW/gp25 family protein [Planctomycetota bacterium]
MSTLPDPRYLAFPFRVGPDGPLTSGRDAHVREQIEQVLFTAAGERVMRPEFGAGVRRLVFEPNDSSLASVTHKRIASALGEALRGEVDPKSLEITVQPDDEKLRITIRYQLATIGHRETVTFQSETS